MENNREQPGQSNFHDYLRKYIGKKVNIEFLIGTNKLVNRTGVLKDVGPDRVVFVNPNGTTTIADLFSIKFIDILN
jgi:ferredoxin-fold anticodon binding domain-containing protein